ncbi:DNA-directed DNA polymerase II large subunit [Methanocaldococcus fervens]|uniref:DNA polymerase II large subunit n=1 Tax=Methanocaldococcus fervens (strain DSM 4213 / JCM 15782 / AG86) TaxID=573064 RepID=C7P996_METFA|nr:DNA-directed DNA polymerase II large subunit [Methanocaldococcus fervens]ACV25128.1 DNA polymerase II, large subunit DP2 [Methanocaldococcus fervens AG86]
MVHVACSENMKKYFESIVDEVKKIYKIAEECRKKGFDPVDEVEIPLAADMADRVEGLVGPKGVAGRIRELVKELGKEPAALEIAKEIVEGKFGDFDKEKKAEQAVRTALAVLTEGIVAAPLEGIADVKIKKNPDGSEYLAIYYAGPIRSAGGTAQALSVLVGDFVRKAMGLDRYKPTEDEIERYVEEVELYQSEVGSFQYNPKADEIRTAVRNIPIEITGEATDDVEVSGHRDLPRVETNQLRGGALLVLVEGVLLKAPKILRHVDKLGIEGWDWLKDLMSKKEEEEEEKDEKIDDEDVDEEEEEISGYWRDIKIEANKKFISEVIAGRPVFAHPSKVGGFRLRYGRSRNTGFATQGFHPALMYLVDEFMAVGTQLKTERPGKATCVVPVDSIEPPIVKLKNGDVIRVDTIEKAIEVRDRVEEILFLGDVLVNYGDFLENNHPLLPSCWCEEWYEKVLIASNVGYDKEFIKNPKPEEAVKFALETKTPLHPRYTYHWHDVSKEDIILLRNWLLKGKEDDFEGKKVWIVGLETEDDKKAKRILELIGCCHLVRNKKVMIEEYYPLLYSLGYDVENKKDLIENIDEILNSAKNSMHLINLLAPFEVRRNTYVYVGARMGRPEKAAPRKMKPPVNGLFPIGNAGGQVRLINKAVEENNTDDIDVSYTRCPKCGKISLYRVCPFCGTKVELDTFGKIKAPLKEYWYAALKRLGINKPGDVKCIKGMTSKQKIVEPLEKAILRAMNEVYVFKDGTTRFDCTDVPVTHFKPNEINVSVEKLRELGYDKDIYGNELVDGDQVVELKPQDVIIPESCAEYFVKVANFIDDLLEKFYNMERFYNVKKKEDLIGHLVIGMAPHTSAGMVGRIIGYTKANVGYAHPYFHAAKRRNCDGDEDSFFLLLDAFLNFSKKFLPDKRGGQMDAPLVLTTILDPKEVDGEVHNMDTMWSYPLEFYEKTLEMPSPKEVKEFMETVEDRLGNPEQYEGIGYTHETSRIDLGPKVCAYKTLGSMLEKTTSQLSVAKKIRATDERDVAEKVIQSHFIPDLIGNLRAFSRQAVRCKCGAKFRRIPLRGKCPKCGSNLILTVSKGAVEKYMDVAEKMAEEYDVNNYIKQRLKIIREGINSIFENDKSKQVKLSDFFKMKT